jgi:hypothetical protein
MHNLYINENEDYIQYKIHIKHDCHMQVVSLVEIVGSNFYRPGPYPTISIVRMAIALVEEKEHNTCSYIC